MKQPTKQANSRVVDRRRSVELVGHLNEDFEGKNARITITLVATTANGAGLIGQKEGNSSFSSNLATAPS